MHAEVEDCNKDFVVGSFLGFVLSAILIIVPCAAMCCATSPTTMMVQQRAVRTPSHIHCMHALQSCHVSAPMAT